MKFSEYLSEGTQDQLGRVDLLHISNNFIKWQNQGNDGILAKAFSKGKNKMSWRDFEAKDQYFKIVERNKLIVTILGVRIKTEDGWEDLGNVDVKIENDGKKITKVS